jgi:hypothetical protein
MADRAGQSPEPSAPSVMLLWILAFRLFSVQKLSKNNQAMPSTVLAFCPGFEERWRT